MTERSDRVDDEKPEKIVMASDVDAVDETQTAEEAQRAEVARIVKSRQTRREALKQAGADLPTGVGSPDLHDSIEKGLERRRDSATAQFRAQQAAARAVEAKRGKR